MADLLKNIYDKKFIKKLSSEIKNVYREFDETKFVKNVINKSWEEKELKQRMRHIAECMKNHLPDNYIKALDILKPVSLKFTGLEHIFFPDFIELCGLNDYKNSISAMAYFTKGSSSEFPVRPFIIKYKDKMMLQMKYWSKSDNEHLRRLASEGCRPRLPWAMALPEFKKDPTPILPILEQLKSDESEYVRRSVANNLNDISKDNPDIVIEIAKRWIGLNKKTDWLVKHACRTLLKSGNVEVLKLFGFKSPSNIKVNKFNITKTIKMGEAIDFGFSLNSKRAKLGKIRLEYAIDFVRKNNKKSRKVFKISEGNYSEYQRQIEKKHSFRKISTRKYYAGKHGLSIIVNGKELLKTNFEIKE